MPSWPAHTGLRTYVAEILPTGKGEVGSARSTVSGRSLPPVPAADYAAIPRYNKSRIHRRHRGRYRPGQRRPTVPYGYGTREPAICHDVLRTDGASNEVEKSRGTDTVLVPVEPGLAFGGLVKMSIVASNVDHRLCPWRPGRRIDVACAEPHLAGGSRIRNLINTVVFLGSRDFHRRSVQTCRDVIGAQNQVDLTLHPAGDEAPDRIVVSRGGCRRNYRRRGRRDHDCRRGCRRRRRGCRVRRRVI